jgi:type I restriction enzyme M protein
LIDQQITLSQLEGHLWESANILRGPVDAADFKTYIFPLLFFKRICDVWDEEYQEIVDETATSSYSPGFRVAPLPDSRRTATGMTSAPRPAMSAALQRAMREIEKANPDTLYGVFGDAQWSNKERLSDALLKDLIEHFSKLPFGNKNVNSDLLGDAYEYLIKKFADATNKKAGEFYTPRSVVRLMIDMLDPKEAETIYDPACGTGGMLLAAVQHVKETARRRQAAVGQAVRAGEEPHHLVHRADEPVPPRHRGLPGGARRHAAQPGLLRGRPAGHLRLRDRQSAVLAGKVGRGPVD